MGSVTANGIPPWGMRPCRRNRRRAVKVEPMAARPGTTTRRSHPRCHRESRRGYDGQHDGRPGDLIATGVDAARQPECEHDRSQERSGADTPRDCVSRLHWSPGRSPGLCDAEHRRPDDDVGNQQTFHNQSGPISEFPSPESRVPDPGSRPATETDLAATRVRGRRLPCARGIPPDRPRC
jgi:hypothetical protein